MAARQETPVAYTPLCFACGKENPIGLKLNFTLDKDRVRATFTPGKFHQGWDDIIHGGLISTVLDEAMSYATYFAAAKCVTGEIAVRFKRPLKVGQSVTVTAWITRNARRYLETRAELKLSDGTLVAEAEAKQFAAGKIASAT